MMILSLSILTGCYRKDKQVKIQDLSEKYCAALNQIDNKALADDILLDSIILISGKLKEENKDMVHEIKQNIANRIKSVDNQKIEYTFSADFVTELLENCPTYLKLMRLHLPKSENDNGTIIYVTDRIKKFITEWENLEPLELYDRATDSIVSSYYYAPNARSDYDHTGFDRIEPYNDIQVELLQTSNEYLKGYLVNEQVRAMGGDAKTFPKPFQLNFPTKLE